MLQDIYHEYSEEIFTYIFKRVDQGMEGQQLIEILVRSYYNRKSAYEIFTQIFC